MKIFFKTSSTILMCTLLTFSGVLSATTGQLEEPESQKEHIVVGSRPFSLAEHVTLQEERAVEEEGAEKGDEEELKTQDLPSETKVDEDGNELQAKGFPFTTSNLTTTHAGIYQNALAVSPLGDTVELSDGSIWNICASDRYKTFDWLTSDQIIIKLNHAWFSLYHYTLVNLNTKKSVQANLSLGPIYNGVNTHWIVAIDYVNNQVCLEDGTVWKMHNSDRLAVNKWIVNDTVIIGVNDGYFSSKKSPNILINVNVLNNARGAVMY